MMTETTPANGRRETLRYATGQSALGRVLVASSTNGVASILIGDDDDGLIAELRHVFPDAALQVLEDDGLVAQVLAVIEDPALCVDFPLDICGTAFQRKVWGALRASSAGVTMTYAALADRVGDPRAVRAVASACAANKLAVVIPCHRVVRRDGSLPGYRWGVPRKIALVAREAAAARTIA
jgi:AraC family transcriptional regulator of adaptative response/methylated-DNA-[protein]-cysteine methyltransferase